mmetsp:Transcript_139975/g.446668  ORF Transcript_139975/g.446668 Transcript_139975/m.446668 type:complete len:313 (+) Transcript_139975:74-1012(+)
MPFETAAPHRRRVGVVAAAGAALATLLHGGVSQAFVGHSSRSFGVASQDVESPITRHVMRGKIWSMGEKKLTVLDQDAEEPRPRYKFQSVFDGDPKEQDDRYYWHRYGGQEFKVDKKTWTYELVDEKDKDVVLETGAWNRDWRMPEKEFRRQRPTLMTQYQKMKRKLAKHYGRQKYPNGQYFHLWALRRSPFLKEKTDKYFYRPDWVWSPDEVKKQEQGRRAFELKRRMVKEQEATRIENLSKLGIYRGRVTWSGPYTDKWQSIKRQLWLKYQVQKNHRSPILPDWKSIDELLGEGDAQDAEMVDDAEDDEE